MNHRKLEIKRAAKLSSKCTSIVTSAERQIVVYSISKAAFGCNSRCSYLTGRWLNTHFVCVWWHIGVCVHDGSGKSAHSLKFAIIARSGGTTLIIPGNEISVREYCHIVLTLAAAPLGEPS